MTNSSENNRSDNGRDNAGRFAPGNPGKPKGSSKNRLRDQVKDFLNSNWPSFQSWFDELKSKEKVDVIIDLLPYAVPRLQAMTDANGEDPLIKSAATVDYSKLSPNTLKEVLANTIITDHE